MTDYLPFLILLACPIGMASMMFLPAFARRFSRCTPATGSEG